jgi:hypothetical protein
MTISVVVEDTHMVQEYTYWNLTSSVMASYTWILEDLGSKMDWRPSECMGNKYGTYIME